MKTHAQTNTGTDQEPSVYANLVKLQKNGHLVNVEFHPKLNFLTHQPNEPPEATMPKKPLHY